MCRESAPLRENSDPLPPSVSVLKERGAVGRRGMNAQDLKQDHAGSYVSLSNT